MSVSVLFFKRNFSGLSLSPLSLKFFFVPLIPNTSFRVACFKNEISVSFILVLFFCLHLFVP